MSFLKSLFGGGKSGGAKASAAQQEAEYKGFRIEARPYMEGGQYQLAGLILKEVDGVMKEHRFVRSDRFSSKDEAGDFAIVKAKQIIDERGDKVFD